MKKLVYNKNDIANVLEANGLPIMFKDLNTNAMNLSMGSINSIASSDYLYVDIK